jgi:hypothetical protein
MLNATPQEIGDKLRASVPAAHVRFLEEMHDSFRFGDYLFVHAGIRPGVPLPNRAARICAGFGKASSTTAPTMV